ncbi:hypothetical protein ACJX0J_042319, partial [Zea mays]
EKEAMPPVVTHEKQGADSSTPSPSILGAPPRNSTSTKSFPPPNGKTKSSMHEYGCDLHVTQSPYPSTNSMDNNEDEEVQRSQIETCPAGAKQKNRMWDEVISHVVSQAASEKWSEDNRKRHKCLLRNHGFHVETSDNSGSNPKERGEAVEEINPRQPANEEKAMTMANSTSPKRRHRRQRNIHQAWANFNNSIDSLTNAQRAYVADSISVQQRREYRKIQNVDMQAFQASIERTICQDFFEVKVTVGRPTVFYCLRKPDLLPGASTSSDNVEGELMRHAKADLAKLLEHHEFIKKDPCRRKYAKQDANVRARRASLKQRELAIPTNSMASKAQRVPYLPPHKRALSNHFEVLSSMPVSVEEEGCNTSDTSSTSAHFKRKKPRKQ